MASIWIAKNILTRLFRELQTYIFLIFFPILSAFIAIAMVSGQSTLVVGVSGLEESSMLEYFNYNSQYEFIEITEGDIDKALEEKTIDFALKLPNGLRATINEGVTPVAEVIALNNTTELQEITGIVNGILNFFYTGDDGIFNHGTDSNAMEKPRIGVGIMTMFIIMYISYGIGVILDDKKEKTFMRSFTAPVKSHDMVLGNLMANLLMGIVQLTIFLVFSTFVLNFQWGVSLVHLFILLFIYMITVIGLSVGVMGFISDNEKYNAVTIVIATATCMLAGSFFPLEHMNPTLQKLANFFPQKWVMESFDQLYRGSSLSDIRLNLMVLVLFAVALFSFGIKTLKPREEDL